jgi:hypothetical protein
VRRPTPAQGSVRWPSTTSTRCANARAKVEILSPMDRPWASGRRAATRAVTSGRSRSRGPRCTGQRRACRTQATHRIVD